MKYFNVEDETLLEKIKRVTKLTDANIFIVDGNYEVYYNSIDCPSKASNDAELDRILDALMLLYSSK